MVCTALLSKQFNSFGIPISTPKMVYILIRDCESATQDPEIINFLYSVHSYNIWQWCFRINKHSLIAFAFSKNSARGSGVRLFSDRFNHGYVHQINGKWPQWKSTSRAMHACMKKNVFQYYRDIREEFSIQMCVIKLQLIRPRSAAIGQRNGHGKINGTTYCI